MIYQVFQEECQLIVMWEGKQIMQTIKLILHTSNAKLYILN